MSVSIGDDGRVTSNAANSADKVSPGHETLVRHARATVAANGAENADLEERVINAIIRAMHPDRRFRLNPIYAEERDAWRPAARVAIGAMGGGK